MGKIIFFDMDGTILYHDEVTGFPVISPRLRMTLKKVQERGHKIFIATGRPYAFLSKDVLDLGFDGYVLTNGACVLYHDQMIYHSPMNISHITPLVQEFEKRKIEYVLQHEKYTYLREFSGNLQKFYDRCSINQDLIIKDFDEREKLEETCKIEAMPVGEENIEFCENVNPKFFNSMGCPPYTFEIYASNVSKATGILKVLELLNIDVKESYAFGDGKNDIEMFQTVNVAIAMGNANDEVKAYANMVCLPVDQDGVAKKLEELFLSN
ncbi:MAG: HAD family hydrolase [Erysipelotrichaceae bacterium]|nr:HAD family hydrolase [Erysipelotrichaceae bacterium]